jgi:hypothetical protein
VRTSRWPTANDSSKSDTLLQPRSLGIPKRKTTVRKSLLLCSDIRQESSWNSTQTSDSHRRLSLGLSGPCAEVTGACLLVNPNPIFIGGCLVLRAVNVPTSTKKFCSLNRKLFVTVSNHETTAKTTDVRVEGQMVKWNQSLDAL